MDPSLKIERDHVNISDYVPVIIRYEHMVKDINSYLDQAVNCGTFSLVLLQPEAEDRELYRAVLENVKTIMDKKDVEILMKEFNDNLLPEPEQSEKLETSTQASSTKGTEDASKKSDHKKDSEKEKTNSQQTTNDKKKGGKPTPSQAGSSQAKPTDKEKSSQPSTSSKQPHSSKETQKKTEEKTAQPQPPAPVVEQKKEVFTFGDILLEVILGKVIAKKFIDHKLLEGHPEYRQILQEYVGKEPALSIRYPNNLKDKCLHCGVSSLHECRVASSNLPKMTELYTTIQKVMGKDVQGCPLTLTALVHSQKLLELLKHRNLREDTVTPLQLRMSVDLEYCLEVMQRKEDMGKDCLVDCSKCGRKTEREVCYIVERAPQFFLIQLKRFKTEIDYKTGHMDKKKNCMMVDLAEKLKIGNQEFELFGVVNHYGEIEKGHYTACVKRPSDGQWFLFDDEKVTKTSFQHVNADCAYLLFYLLQQGNSPN